MGLESSDRFDPGFQENLPLPLSRLYARAFHAKGERDRHDHAFHLVEASLKLAASALAGLRIPPGEEEATENLTRYIIRASFSQERITYLPEESKVIYESKDGKEEKIFDALDWLAAMTSHVPNKGEQMVRYYGHYSNASRGLRQKENLDDLIPSILQPEDLKPNRTWARLIQKIYEVDPLTCPKCQGQMRILAFIEDEEVIEKILKHLGLWDLKVRPPPKVKVSFVTISIDYSDSHVPFSGPSFYLDPDYPMDSYVS